MKNSSKPRSSLDLQVGRRRRRSRSARPCGARPRGPRCRRRAPSCAARRRRRRDRWSPPAGSPARPRPGSGRPRAASARGTSCRTRRGSRASVVADPLDRQLHARGGRGLGVHVRRAGDLPGQLGDVLALVAVLGRLLAARAGHDRRAEPGDLPARVVEVVLALDLVALEAEQPQQGVAVGGVAPVRRRSAGRSGWRRRTRPGSSRAGPPCPRRSRRRPPARARRPPCTSRRRGRCSGSPGRRPPRARPASPACSCSAAPSRSAISRGGAFSAGASSIAALVE